MTTATTIDDSMEKMTSLTLTDNTTEVTESPPLRGIFSLPRELRDQVYGYLLLHEYMRAPPHHIRRADTSSETQRDMSVAHTYNFYPSLLCVNRQISEEASSVLALNSFVVVSAQWNGLKIAKHYHDLAIVCEDQTSVAKFKHHHLRVHIRHGMKQKRTEKICSFVIVASELSTLCDMLQWSFLNTPSPSQMLVPAATGSRQEVFLVGPTLQFEKDCITHTHLQLLSTKIRPMTVGLERSLLQPFVGVVIGQQKVSITNSLQTQTEIIALQARMGPSYVSHSPTSWTAVSLVRSLKHTADLLLEQGDYVRALIKYSWVSAFVPALQPLLVPEQDYHSLRDGPAVAIALLLRLIMDAASL
ncbi:hypothetical protein LTR56_017685 [Elasticomyces elasticus]|nr:hypothetical protein LTR56_017685 [Elasticomyces elasticus]KAK3643786.1 hypothetical protein LTR22_015522 [Elasticomyces elasticus]KAK4912992.1 hypothetical protein LTR49_018639 [Elasticomyces elasticus]KAK5752399.1 hypothetical protein LTS12_017530 [Elasticomyces elasticus]